MKPDTNKYQGIVDIVQPKVMTEEQVLIRMLQYYRYIWRKRLHVIEPPSEASIISKVGKLLWKNEMEAAL